MTGAAAFRRASGCQGGSCVEVGHGSGVVVIRDSALEGSPAIEFSASAWMSFTAGLQDAPERR